MGATGRADRLDFQYSLDATSLSNGTWTDVDALDFSSPFTTTVGQTNSSDPALQSTRNSSIGGIAVPNGAAFWVRWTSFDASGADDGLAVDSFSLTAFFGDQPPTVVATYPADGGTDTPAGDNLTVTFGEPVTVETGWVSVICDVSGDHDLVVSGGPTTFTLDPVTPFAAGEGCEVFILADGVVDQDGTPDAMLTGYDFSFATRGSTCGGPATKIHDVQGAGSASPMVAATVTLQGIVVGDYRGSSGLSGFFLQEEAADADANAATSEGIFVFKALAA